MIKYYRGSLRRLEGLNAQVGSMNMKKMNDI